MNMEKVNKKGQKIRITLTDGDQYEGTVHSFNKQAGRICLHSVTDLSTTTYFDSLYNYFHNEIREIVIIEDAFGTNVKVTSQRLKPNEQLWNNLPIEEVQRLQWMKQNPMLINKLDEDYKHALSDLNSRETVALDAKHAHLGRHIKMSYLLVATWETVYVFDVQIGGQTFFDSGLRKLLQCTGIVKVLHGGAKIADCLLHQYRVNLENVFDTQICDNLLTNKKLVNPICERTLSECLAEYLCAPARFIDDSTGFPWWKQRPLPGEMWLRIADHVTYLITLKNTLQKRNDADFYQNVNVYLSHMADMDPGTAYNVALKQSLLPEDFQKVII